MDDAKKQLADRLKSANNVLVTVSRNPSVDQLASCIGLALLLNKQGKHTAAVFSGQVPSTIEFLQPEETLEQNTDSLRDFIIALDKSKADKLRYKVEDNVVRIFITPYKTSIGEADLEFSQGDFNVDVVVALGVSKQEDLDAAITAHGRILHDATVASITTSTDGELGSINWHDAQSSSLSELVTELAQAIDPNLLDSQIATALLTGIVSETDRFGNDKTSPQTMSASAALMSAGANQQLVASKLMETPRPGAPMPIQGANGVFPDTPSADGAIQIDHNEPSAATNVTADAVPPEPEPQPDNAPADESATPEPSQPLPAEPEKPEPEPAESTSALSPGSRMITTPPTMGGMLTANSREEQLDPATDPFSLPTAEPPQLLERKPEPSTAPPTFTPPPPLPTWSPPPIEPPSTPLSTPPTSPPPSPLPSATDTDKKRTLSDLETEVKQSELKEAKAGANLDEARDEVSRALSNSAVLAQQDMPDPIQALNAQPLGDDLHPAPPLEPTPDPAQPPSPQPTSPPAEPKVTDANAPPPVPPPIPFQFGNPPNKE